MSTPWLPNGGLKDGTMLFGPLKERPKQDMGPILEVVVGGVTHYVVYCCKALSDAQKQEVQQWAEPMLSRKAP